MNAYIDLLKTPGIARIIAAQLTARLPGGMLSLAILLHVEQIHNSYGAAGLVLAATSIGQGIAGPLTSRWMGIWGMRKVLILTLIVSAAAIFTIALVPLSVGMFMVVGLIAGLSNPPVQPAVRTIYPKMVNSKQLTPLFSLDASAQEIIWVAGPVVATFLAIQISTTTAIVVAGAFLLGGGAWFIASPEVGQVRIPRSKRSFGTVLRRPPVMLATITGFLLVGAAAAVEASVVSVFGHDGPQAGFVLGIWAIGSLFGGLFLGHLPIGPWALARRMFIVFVGMALAMFSLNFWWLSITLLIAGIGIAPAFAVIFAIVSASVKFSDTAEAYGWVGTGQLIGAALGSAVAGFLIDAYGPIGGFWAATVIAALGVLVPTVLRGWHPDLRGKDASPIPDTEPISTLRQ
ncbi:MULTISPECIES: MFS transporter [unclassified Salinibacterium]|uniref:MFS transporter n=1 Tax=unclassified Salinibacterium TaxID=2632331 RepID=UPI0018CFCB21|nr:MULTISPECIES: MFS transporter [unclassified Salinibacterium]MBH0054797.1 MFS transporter [Salinibacterium sp. SWN139]MBH0084058.1 MFS transporter [Salinibacterium sp. SWN167]MBH0117448.1 MFS transporter [Salinibacterium sp. NG253]MBH0131075.1 MFS transporter [Salinibacterium sp. NK8237]